MDGRGVRDALSIPKHPPHGLEAQGHLALVSPGGFGTGKVVEAAPPVLREMGLSRREI